MSKQKVLKVFWRKKEKSMFFYRLTSNEPD